MDKKLLKSFVFSMIGFLGLGMGLTSLILFLVRGNINFLNITIPIIMILFGLLGVVLLFDEK